MKQGRRNLAVGSVCGRHQKPRSVGRMGHGGTRKTKGPSPIHHRELV
nr:MAG TPA: hypothetical protein [Caudoviricetes sp.]